MKTPVRMAEYYRVHIHFRTCPNQICFQPFHIVCARTKQSHLFMAGPRVIPLLLLSLSPAKCNLSHEQTKVQCLILSCTYVWAVSERPRVNSD